MKKLCFNLANYSVFAIENSSNKKTHNALNGEHHGLNCSESIMKAALPCSAFDLNEQLFIPMAKNNNTKKGNNNETLYTTTMLRVSRHSVDTSGGKTAI